MGKGKREDWDRGVTQCGGVIVPPHPVAFCCGLWCFTSNPPPEGAPIIKPKKTQRKPLKPFQKNLKDDLFNISKITSLNAILYVPSGAKPQVLGRHNCATASTASCGLSMLCFFGSDFACVPTLPALRTCRIGCGFIGLRGGRWGRSPDLTWGQLSSLPTGCLMILDGFLAAEWLPPTGSNIRNANANLCETAASFVGRGGVGAKRCVEMVVGVVFGTVSRWKSDG